MKISLLCNDGFKWNEIDSHYYKGYMFYKGQLVSGGVLSELINRYSVKDLVHELNGIFVLIIRKSDATYLISDITRTFPLYYSCSSGLITDMPNLFKYSFHEQVNTNEFLSTSFVTGDNTLFQEVNQLESSQVVEIINNNIISKYTYYSYFVTNQQLSSCDYGSLSQGLDSVLRNVIDRFKQTVQVGQQLVIPLSGGYDSRLLASLIKEAGFDNVVCYTYGRLDSFEVKISKQVASLLGFKWYFVEYTEELFEGYTGNNAIKLEEYLTYVNSLASLSCIQEFYAVAELRKESVVEDNCIFLPGHTFDFISGGHLISKNYSKDELICAIKAKHYSLNSVNYSTTKIRVILDGYFNQVSDALEYSVYENFNMRERQSKFIVNANRVYEFFGYEHRVLFWDKELVEFFRILPFELKIKQKFFIDHVFNRYFTKFKIDFYKTKLTFLQRVLRKLKLLRINTDVNNWSILEKVLVNYYGLQPQNNINAVLCNLQLRLLNSKYEKN